MKFKPSLLLLTLIFVMGVILFYGCSSPPDSEVDICLLNTEFFFDPLEPHGRVVGTSIDIPSEAEYRAEAKAIATLIDRYQADLVGLTEVENRACVELVRSYLRRGNEWQVVFKKGRDTYTGQDVAVLSKFPVKESSITTFPDQRVTYIDRGESKSVRPSKILGCELRIASEPVYLVIAHLISKRSNNDAKRLGQATVVRRQAIRALTNNQNVIVIGDFNDTPNTPVLRQLRGLSDEWADFVQTAESVPLEDRYTYIYQDNRYLIDHILISPSLQDEFLNTPATDRCQIFDSDGLSDHRGMIVRLQFADF